MPVPNHRAPLRTGRLLRRLARCGSAAAALVCLLCLTGCYSEFMGPAPHDILIVKEQPGGSFRLGRIHRTEYAVHLFWGIWTPKKTNSWKTLESETIGKGAAGIYNLQIETYMPWWHIFPAWLTGGIVDVSAHTITADPFSYAGNPAMTPSPSAAPPPPTTTTAPTGTPTVPTVPTAGQPDVTPTQKPPEGAILQGDPSQPDTPAPLPGRDPGKPNAPPPVTAPQ